jgi:hypothetical protein
MSACRRCPRGTTTGMVAPVASSPSNSVPGARVKRPRCG